MRSFIVSSKTTDAVSKAARRGTGSILRYGLDSVLWGRAMDEEHILLDVEIKSPTGNNGFETANIITTDARGSYVSDINYKAADALLRSCKDNTTSKTRHNLTVNGVKCYLEVYHARHDGLILLRTELTHQQDPPEWCGTEVTSDPRFSEASLSRRPGVPKL